MSDTASETPRRLNAATLEAHRHELEMARATKPGREELPSFGAKRSTASGSLGVMEIRADVPVCSEYDTAEKAFSAMVDFMDRAAAHWPLPDGYVRAK